MIGTVVSGTSSPTLNAGIGLAYIPPTVATPGTSIQIEIRGKRFAAEGLKSLSTGKPSPKSNSFPGSWGGILRDQVQEKRREFLNPGVCHSKRQTASALPQRAS